MKSDSLLTDEAIYRKINQAYEMAALAAQDCDTTDFNYHMKRITELQEELESR